MSCISGKWAVVLACLCCLVKCQRTYSTDSSQQDVVKPAEACPYTDVCVQATAAAISMVVENNSTWDRIGAEAMIAQLIATCRGEKQVVYLQDIVMMVGTEADTVFWNAAQEYADITGFQVVKHQVPILEISEAIIEHVSSNWNVLRRQYHAWTFESASTADLKDAGALLDLAPYVQGSVNPPWDLLLPHLKAQVTNGLGGKLLSIPVASNMIHLFYRRDIMHAQGLDVPHTWQELLGQARALNGTVDTDGDGQPDWALCMALDGGYHSVEVFLSILASINQPGPASLGFLLDPPTLELLVDTPGGALAMELYQGLANLSAPETFSLSSDSHSLFLQRKCVMTVWWTPLFKASVLTPDVHPLVGVAELPGSDVVMERQPRQLVRCTDRPGLCVAVAAKSITNSTEGNDKQEPVGQGAPEHLETEHTFNRAPMAGMVVSLGVNPAVDSNYRKATFNLINHIANSVYASEDNVFSPQTPTGPVCWDHLHPEKWVKAGFNEEAVTQFLAATTATWSHPHFSSGLRLLHLQHFRNVIGQALVEVMDSQQNVSALVAQLQTHLSEGVPTDHEEREAFQHAYWEGIGFKVPVEREVSDDDDPDRMHMVIVIIAVVVPVVVVAILAVLVLVLYKKARKSANKTMMGHTKAPQAPDTTLIITDIEGSTDLWDTLDPSVMDVVLMLHHATVRALCLKHNGYESGTEGDSFVLAFHKPSDAVMFAVHVQDALMDCSWPQELLDAPQGAPLYVTPQEKDADVLSGHNSARFLNRDPGSKAMRSGVSVGQSLSSLFGRASTRNSDWQQPSSARARGFSEHAGRRRRVMAEARPRRGSMGEGPWTPTSLNPSLAVVLDPCFSAPSAPQLTSIEDIPAPTSAHTFTTATHTCVAPEPRPSLTTLDADAAPCQQQRSREVGVRNPTVRAMTRLWLTGSQADILMAGDAPASTLPTQCPPTCCDAQAPQGMLQRLATPPRPSPSSLYALPSQPAWASPSSNLPAIATHAPDEGRLVMGGEVQGFASIFPGQKTSRNQPMCDSNGILFRIGRESLDYGFGYKHDSSDGGDSSGHVAETTSFTPYTLARHLESCYPKADGPGEGRIRVFYGLRVRIGMHTGMSNPLDATYNRTAGRMQYTGAFSASTRIVQNAAPGGVSLLCEHTKQALGAGWEASADMVVAHMGEHLLGWDDSQRLVHLYAVFRTHHLPRLVYAQPIRYTPSPLTAPGILFAPYGVAVIGYMYVMGLKPLLAHDMALVSQCLTIYRRKAAAELNKQGGYLVEESDGLLLVTFTDSSRALNWGLDTLSSCLEADWPPALQQSLEALAQIPRPVPAAVSLDRGLPPTPSTLAAASYPGVGLRIKAGFDVGKVSVCVHNALGRASYRGKAMNRAARIAGMAKAGQVWCSSSVWTNYQYEASHHSVLGTVSLENSLHLRSQPQGHQLISQTGRSDNIFAESQGMFKLKGVSVEMELMRVQYSAPGSHSAFPNTGASSSGSPAGPLSAYGSDPTPLTQPRSSKPQSASMYTVKEEERHLGGDDPMLPRAALNRARAVDFPV